MSGKQRAAIALRAERSLGTEQAASSWSRPPEDSSSVSLISICCKHMNKVSAAVCVPIAYLRFADVGLVVV